MIELIGRSINRNTKDVYSTPELKGREAEAGLIVRFPSISSVFKATLVTCLALPASSAQANETIGGVCQTSLAGFGLGTIGAYTYFSAKTDAKLFPLNAFEASRFCNDFKRRNGIFSDPVSLNQLIENFEDEHRRRMNNEVSAIWKVWASIKREYIPKIADKLGNFIINSTRHLPGSDLAADGIRTFVRYIYDRHSQQAINASAAEGLVFNLSAYRAIDNQYACRMDLAGLKVLSRAYETAAVIAGEHAKLFCDKSGSVNIGHKARCHELKQEFENIMRRRNLLLANPFSGAAWTRPIAVDYQLRLANYMGQPWYWPRSVNETIQIAIGNASPVPTPNANVVHLNHKDSAFDAFVMRKVALALGIPAIEVKFSASLKKEGLFCDSIESIIAEKVIETGYNNPMVILDLSEDSELSSLTSRQLGNNEPGIGAEENRVRPFAQLGEECSSADILDRIAEKPGKKGPLFYHQEDRIAVNISRATFVLIGGDKYLAPYYIESFWDSDSFLNLRGRILWFDFYVEKGFGQDAALRECQPTDFPHAYAHTAFVSSPFSGHSFIPWKTLGLFEQDWKVPGTTIVRYVLPDSPAFSSGIEVGDHIVERAFIAPLATFNLSVIKPYGHHKEIAIPLTRDGYYSREVYHPGPDYLAEVVANMVFSVLHEHHVSSRVLNTLIDRQAPKLYRNLRDEILKDCGSVSDIVMRAWRYIEQSAVKGALPVTHFRQNSLQGVKQDSDK